MSNLRFHLRLPRRVTAYFLLFGLTAVVWLGGSAFYVAKSVDQERSESGVLRRLGRATSRMAIDYLRGGEATLDASVERIRRECRADYCAVISPAGRYLAHSTAALAGQRAESHQGSSEQWGTTERVEYVNQSGQRVAQYRMPLTAGQQAIGTLVLGIAQAGWGGALHSAAQYAPLAIVGPVCFMAAGAVLLHRMVRPVADIEEQLSRVATSPAVEGCELHQVPAIGAAALGWNRVVVERTTHGRSDALGEQIDDSLEKGRHNRLDGVLNSLPDGVATTDRHGRLTYTNVSMATILGLEGEAAAGDHRPDEAVRMVDQLTETWQLTSSSPLLAEEHLDRPVVTELTRSDQGQRRVVRVARHPVHLSGGSQRETHVWMLRDVTQQKLAEEMRDQFVDAATHELRTPLANIKAYAETLALADMIDVEQQKQFLNTINSEASRLARFVDDLLNVSSMEVGSLTLNKQVTDLHRMLGEVLTKVRPQVEEKQLTFEVSIPEKLPEPNLDKDKIATVLVNLLGNAIKYTPAGGRVAFRVQHREPHLEIDIEDTGVGIAEDELPRVFERFFRSGDPRVQEQKGTGLGLALAQEVIQLHGGRITVDSHIDQGSTFQVVLPSA